MSSESGLECVGSRVDSVRVIVYSLRDSWSEPLNPFMLIDMGKRVQYSLFESTLQFFIMCRVKNDSYLSG